MIIGNSISDAWMQLLLTLKYANKVNPRGIECREEQGLSIRVLDMRQNILVHHKRKLNYRFMVAEWLWIAAARDDVASLARFNSKIAAFSDDGKIFAGAYGPRLAPQWFWAYKKLIADPDTRQAVVSIWTPTPAGSKDIPCTLSMQFLRRVGQLNCVVTMRSSDAWLGIPYDFFSFSMLANSFAGELGLVPGWLQINIGSSHLYATDYEKANAVVFDNAAGFTVRSPNLNAQLSSTAVNYQKVLETPTSLEALKMLMSFSPKSYVRPSEPEEPISDGIVDNDLQG